MNVNLIKYCVALTLSLGVGAIYLAFNAYKRRRKEFKRSDIADHLWNNVGTIKSLWIYPVKSCRGISVPKFTAKKEGAMVGHFRDRSFIIVDRQNNMVTGRKKPALVTIQPQLNQEDATLTLTCLGTVPLVLNLHIVEALGEPCVVTVWGESIPGVDCGEEATSWLNPIIGVGHKLVYHKDKTSWRIVTEESRFNYVMKTDGALFADRFPYLLATTASVTDFGARAGEDFPTQNFRPNILLQNIIPYEEDDWTFLQVAGLHFRHTKKCERCVFTTVNYETGERHPNSEPLHTLRQYRLQKNGKPVFGINLAFFNNLETEREISVGDIIYASNCPRMED